jgi:hypothetical protein
MILNSLLHYLLFRRFHHVLSRIFHRLPHRLLSRRFHRLLHHLLHRLLHRRFLQKTRTNNRRTDRTLAFPPQEQRGHLAEQSKKKSTSGKSSHRKRGVNAHNVGAQCDSSANRAAHAAYCSVATFIDTIRYTERLPYEPRRVVVLIELNEVEDSSNTGGSTTNGNTRRAKTQMALVSSTKEDRQYAIKGFKEAFGGTTETRSRFDKVTLLTDPEDHEAVYPSVSRHVSQLLGVRSGPSKKPRSDAQVLAPSPLQG